MPILELRNYLLAPGRSRDFMRYFEEQFLDSQRDQGIEPSDTVAAVREHGADRLLPLPANGRVYTSDRRVRFGDVSRGGRCRFDALADYVQDVAADDTADAGLQDESAWVVRRSVIEVVQPAAFRELLTLQTFCSGTGGRWAERRVVMRGSRTAGGRIAPAPSVRWRGLEPPRGCPHKALNLARLPIPPPALAGPL